MGRKVNYKLNNKVFTVFVRFVALTWYFFLVIEWPISYFLQQIQEFIKYRYISINYNRCIC